MDILLLYLLVLILPDEVRCKTVNIAVLEAIISTNEILIYNFSHFVKNIINRIKLLCMFSQKLDDIIKSMGLNVRIIQIQKQQDDFIGPLLHLPLCVQKDLIRLLLGADSQFKRLYNVETNGDLITYSNRWEFLSISL